MQITITGRGRVGGGRCCRPRPARGAQRWRAADHEVTGLGRDGGGATGADVIVVAIPGDAIGAGLEAITGLGGQVTIGAANTYGDRPSATSR